MNSNQSAFLFGYLFFAFFVFITLKGELPAYAGLLLLSPGGASNNGASSNAQSTASDQAASFIGTAVKAFVAG